MLYFVSFKNINQDIVRDSEVEYNVFDWQRWEGTPVFEVAEYVLEWAEQALVMAEFSRGDYSFSLECILVLLGKRVRGFLIRRVTKVNSHNFRSNLNISVLTLNRLSLINSRR